MKAVAEWIWVIGGVLAGLIIFSVVQTQLYQLNLATAERRSLEQFYELKNIINNLCWSFVGNTREYELTLSENIDGIYAAKDKYQEYTKDELVEFILNEYISKGEWLCIKIRDKRLRCEELECNASMIFIGSVPVEFSLTALVNRLLGRGEIFSYKLTLLRDLDKVLVYKPVTQFLFADCIIDKPKNTVTCRINCESAKLMILLNAETIYGKPEVRENEVIFIDNRISALRCPVDAIIICDKPERVGIQTNLSC